MKSTIKVSSISNQNDVRRIREAIASNEGVVACEVNILNSEVNIIYDNKVISIDEIINSIEAVGYNEI